jgi:hypothetical protein
MLIMQNSKDQRSVFGLIFFQDNAKDDSGFKKPKPLVLARHLLALALSFAILASSQWAILVHAEESGIESGLLLYFPFDRDSGSVATDEVSGVTGVASGVEFTGGAAKFSSASNNIFVTAGDAFSSIEELTLGAWVKASDTSGSPFLMSSPWSEDYDWTRKTGVLAWNLGSENEIGFTLIGNDGLDAYDSTSSGDVADISGKWRHVALSYSSAAGAVRFYLDGALIAEKVFSTSIPADLSSFHIGAYNWGLEDGGKRCFSGEMDELRVYSRILSDADVLVLSAANRPTEEESGEPDITSGLELYFPFDSGALDAVSGIEGVASGVEFSDGAAKFSSASNNIFVTAGDAFSSMEELTLGAWVKASDISGSPFLLSSPWSSDYDWTRKTGVLAWNLGSENEIGFTLIGNKGLDEYDSTSSGAVGDISGEWRHVALSYSSAAGAVRFYLDGVFLGEKVFSTSIPADLSSFHIGAYNWGLDSEGDRCFSGEMDELRVYGRVVSDADVLALSAVNKPKEDEPSQSKRIAYWPFNEGSGIQSVSVDSQVSAELSGGVWVEGVSGSAVRFPDVGGRGT